MTSCTMHSIIIYKPDGVSVDHVKHWKNSIFPITCANNGLKYLADDGSILHTNKYYFTLHEESDPLKGGNKIYNAIPKAPPACYTTISQELGEYIVNANVNDGKDIIFVASNNDISYINTTLEKDSIELLKRIEYQYLGGVAQGLGSNFRINSIIQPLLWKGANAAIPHNQLYPNYVWIYDSSLDINIQSKAWTHKNVAKYNDTYEPSGGMNLHLINNNEWIIYNSLYDKESYKREINQLDSLFVNSQYGVYQENFYKDGSSAMFDIFSKDIIKIPTDCSKIIFEMYRYLTQIEIKATVVHTSAAGPQPSSNLTIKKFYTPGVSGGIHKFDITPFIDSYKTPSAFNIFNNIIPFAVESPAPTKFNNLQIKIRASDTIIPTNISPNNRICKIPKGTSPTPPAPTPPVCNQTQMINATWYDVSSCNKIWQAPCPDFARVSGQCTNNCEKSIAAPNGGIPPYGLCSAAQQSLFGTCGPAICTTPMTPPSRPELTNE